MWGEVSRERTKAAAELRLPGRSAAPPTLPPSARPFPPRLSRVVQGWDLLLAWKNAASGTLTVAAWRCGCVLKCSFVVRVLDVHTAIK